MNLNCRAGTDGVAICVGRIGRRRFIVGFHIFLDDLPALPRLFGAPLGVHFLPPAVGLFLPLVLFQFQVERQARDASHDQEGEHRDEPDAELVERQQDRDDGRGDEQVLDLKLKAKIAQAGEPLAATISLSRLASKSR